MSSVRDELRIAGLKEQTILGTDIFMYFVDSRDDHAVDEVEDENYDFDHDDIIDKLVELGGGLGFEATAEKTLGKGSRVDALWYAKIGNLGTVKYVFEVQRGGSTDSLILNLQRAKSDPEVQKVVVVANKKMLSKIKDEVKDLSGDFTRSLAYIEVIDVLKATSLLLELNDTLSKLELIKR